MGSHPRWSQEKRLFFWMCRNYAYILISTHIPVSDKNVTLNECIWMWRKLNSLMNPFSLGTMLTLSYALNFVRLFVKMYFWHSSFSSSLRLTKVLYNLHYVEASIIHGPVGTTMKIRNEYGTANTLPCLLCEYLTGNYPRRRTENNFDFSIIIIERCKLLHIKSVDSN